MKWDCSDVVCMANAACFYMWFTALSVTIYNIWNHVNVMDLGCALVGAQFILLSKDNLSQSINNFMLLPDN